MPCPRVSIKPRSPKHGKKQYIGIMEGEKNQICIDIDFAWSIVIISSRGKGSICWAVRPNGLRYHAGVGCYLHDSKNFVDTYSSQDMPTFGERFID